MPAVDPKPRFVISTESGYYQGWWQQNAEPFFCRNSCDANRMSLSGAKKAAKRLLDKRIWGCRRAEVLPAPACADYAA